MLDRASLETEVLGFLGRIEPLSDVKLWEAKEHLDSRSKPVGSLGRLESVCARLFAMGRLQIAPAAMFTVVGDHGVHCHGICSSPQWLTRKLVESYLRGGGAINVLTAAAGMDFVLVDAGCAGGSFSDSRIVDRRLGDGTKDMLLGSAMSLERCLEGLLNGILLAKEYCEKGYCALGIGEAGMGNSTSASALYSALLSIPPKQAVGPGAGGSHGMIERKAKVVALAMNANQELLEKGGLPPWRGVHALAALGGFEIVTMTGILLGAAALKLPVLVDGFIAGAAYAAACFISPPAAEYCFLSHQSAEPGHILALQRLKGRLRCSEWGEPLLDLGMRLGEGTGAAVAYGLLQAAVACWEMERLGG